MPNEDWGPVIESVIGQDVSLHLRSEYSDSLSQEFDQPTPGGTKVHIQAVKSVPVTGRMERSPFPRFVALRQDIDAETAQLAEVPEGSSAVAYIPFEALAFVAVQGSVSVVRGL